MAPGSSTTSVFNMVLNTVGASGFGQALGRAQSSINSVTVSINRSQQAAKTGKVSAEAQAIAFEKLSASANLANIRLDTHRSKLAAVQQAKAGYTASEAAAIAETARLIALLDYQATSYNKLAKNTNANRGILTAWENKMRETTDAVYKNQKAQLENNKAVSEATAKEKLLQGQLRGREARLDALTQKMRATNKPLSQFESFVATLIQIYRTVDKVSRTFDRLTLTIGRTLRIIDKIKGFFGGGTAAGGIGGIDKNALASHDSLATKLQANIKGIGVLGMTAAHVLGTIIVNSAMAAINAIRGLAQAAIKAVADFERFTISMNTLLAVQIRNKDATLSLNDAMEQTKEVTAGLLRWLTKLAILSPFTLDDVKAAYQNAITMGFAADQAMRLTKATLDWAAASGRSGAQAEHVVFILGQMRNAGKLLYQDLFQLAQLGIGLDTLNQALARSLNKTTAEIIALRDAGKITAAQGIEAIQQYMEQFGGAAEAQAKTLTGLISSMGDIGPLFLRAIFGPMDLASGKVEGALGSMQRSMSKFVDFLQQEWVLEVAAKIGRGIGAITDKAFDWGENFVVQFANGMMAGVRAIVAALTSIFNTVAFWLSPGSPPNLFPDLPEWGKAAMTEYFKGFSLADISIFKDVTSTIEAVLRSALTNETGDKLGILGNIFGSRQAIAAAISELDKLGRVTEAAFQRIFAASGGASMEMQNFLRTAFALEAQSRKVKAAQDELNRVTKYYSDLLKPVDDQLESLSNAQQDYEADLRITHLQLVANDPNATAAEKAMALMEIDKLNAEKKRRLIVTEAKVAIDAAQANLTAEEDKMIALQQQYDLQKGILDLQVDQNRLMQEYLDTMKQLMAENAPKGGGGGDPKRPTTDQGGGLPTFELPKIVMPQFIKDLETAFHNLKVAWDIMWAKIMIKLEPLREPFERLKTAVDDLGKAFGDSGPEIESFVADGILFLVNTIATYGPGIIDDVTEIVKNITTIWEEHGTEIMGVINFIWRVLVMAFAIGLKIITGIVRFITDLLAGKGWDKAKDQLSKALGDIVQMALDVVGKKLTAFQTTTLGKLLRLGLDMVGNIINAILFYLVAVGAAITGDWNRWLEAIGKAWGQVFEFIFSIGEMIGILIKARFTAWLTEMEIKIRVFIEVFKEKWGTFWENIRIRFVTFVDKLNTRWDAWVHGIKIRLSMFIINFQTAWDTFWENVRSAAAGKLAAVVEGIAAMITDAGTAITEAKDDFVAWGGDIIQGLIDGVVAKASGLATAVVDAIKGAFKAGNEYTISKSPSKKAAKMLGQPISQGIAMGILESSGLVKNAMVSVLGGAIHPPATSGQIAGNSATNSYSMTNQYNLNATTTHPMNSVAHEFAIMQAMAGST